MLRKKFTSSFHGNKKGVYPGNNQDNLKQLVEAIKGTEESH